MAGGKVAGDMTRRTESPIDGDEAHQIGIEAYLYLYPLVTFDLTRRVMTNRPADEKPGVGPPNAFHHMREYPSAAFRDVVRPNFDTLYSLAWLDLTAGPLIMSVPDSGGRYYLLPLIDMWTDVFAVPGLRTTGTAAANFAVVTPRWQGELPSDLEVIVAPTPYVQVGGRTQTNGPADYGAVHEFQDGLAITALDGTRTEAALDVDGSVDMATPPLVQVNSMDAAEFFARGTSLMGLHPPHVTDWSIVARMQRIGLVPGERFDLGSVPPRIRAALATVPADAVTMMRDKLPTLARVVNGWQMNTETMGVYGNAYLKRAIVAMVGLGANPAEDALYPLNVGDADGRPVVGTNDYVLHFEASEIPPVDAFWSLTMYDDEGFPVPNPIDRYAVGDRDQLAFNSDGSLDIVIQRDAPGPDRRPNWLPAPDGPMGLTMRLYAPRPEALDGRWAPPAVRRVR